MTNNIQNFNNYVDVIKKAKYDFDKHYKEGDTYSLINCFLTINCIVEWITNDKTSNIPVAIVAEAENFKRSIANGNTNSDSTIDGDKIKNNDIKEQINFVRIVCNHAKHNNSDKLQFFEIKIGEGAYFPLRFPQNLQHVYVELNGQEIPLIDVAENIINFWENLLKQNGINI